MNLPLSSESYLTAGAMMAILMVLKLHQMKKKKLRYLWMIKETY